MNLNLNKQTLASITCILSFLIGWSLTIAGFIVPPTGDVSDSVLWILGQALLYCGAVIGINEHYKTETNKFKQEVIDKIKEK